MSTRVSIGRLARESGLSVSRIRQLADEGLVPFTRTQGGHRRFDMDDALAAVAQRPGGRKGLGSTEESESPASSRESTGAGEFSARVPLVGLQEDTLWAEVARRLGIDEQSRAGHTLHYAVTEMVNNAVDHSSGSRVDVRVSADARTFSFEIDDDGVGAFAHLMEGLGLPDETTALEELTKGLRTTDPDHHTGEGIFFTSKALDSFELATASLSWRVDNVRSDQAVGAGSGVPGTTVRGVIARDTERDLIDVFNEFAPEFSVDRTRVVVKLFERGASFVSRSEAKRLLHGLDEFREVILDFAGVERVGQGFVDETFRVWASAHPATMLVPENMIGPVEYMVRRTTG